MIVAVVHGHCFYMFQVLHDPLGCQLNFTARVQVLLIADGSVNLVRGVVVNRVFIFRDLIFDLNAQRH